MITVEYHFTISAAVYSENQADYMQLAKHLFSTGKMIKRLMQAGWAIQYEEGTSEGDQYYIALKETPGQEELLKDLTELDLPGALVVIEGEYFSYNPEAKTLAPSD